MTIKRRRFKHTSSFQDRLAEEAKRFREAAENLPDGPQKELYLQRARQCETVSHLNEWLNSPGLRPPTGLSSPTDKHK
jgi:uncharacterized protein YkwD